MDAQIELRQLPDMERCVWGKGKDLGKLVSKAGKQNKTSLRIFQTFLFSSQRASSPRSPRGRRPCWNPDG